MHGIEAYRGESLISNNHIFKHKMALYRNMHGVEARARKNISRLEHLDRNVQGVEVRA